MMRARTALDTSPSARLASALLAGLAAAGCGASARPFAVRDPVTVDTDTRAVSVACRKEPSDNDPNHVSCAPREYVSPLIWDGTDNLLFRPLAEVWTFPASSEAANANSLDEVADSAWFNNRIGVRPMDVEEVARGACEPDQLLDGENAEPGAWLVDKGKTDGSSAGFRINVRGKKYLLKTDTDAAERSSAASTIGAAAYNAVGFNTSCEHVVYFYPSVLKLKPGLVNKSNFSEAQAFDQAALDRILALAPKKDGRVRMQASAWLPGKLLGPFRYEGTRDDDPNDVVPHQDRRELRGGRVLAAWLDHFDAREQNSMDSWISERKDVPDASPGHVVHYYLDTSDCLGSSWAWEPITRRLGHSYIVDWGDVGRDFVTLGIPLRPWDKVKRTPGHEVFNFFDVESFDPDGWKNEYINTAFSRATERDNAWMARILSHVTPPMVQKLAEIGRLAHPEDTAYLAATLQGRLDKILQRYLTRLSPVADVRVKGREVCATDLAEMRGLRPAGSFQYTARVGPQWLAVTRKPGGGVCAVVPPGAGSDTGPVQVVLRDGVARGALVVHLVEASGGGLRLVGLERPDEG